MLTSDKIAALTSLHAVTDFTACTNFDALLTDIHRQAMADGDDRSVSMAVYGDRDVIRIGEAA